TWSAPDVLTGVVAGTVARAVLAWMPLLAGADEPEVAAEWARLAGEEPDLRKRADLGGLAGVFAGLAGRKAVWHTVLEGWAVERSQFLEEIERRGELRSARSYPLLLLRTRLRQEVPADLVQAIQQQTDSATLDRWFNEAMTLTSLDEARAALGLSMPS